MAQMAGIEYRRATAADAFSLMKLHQIAVDEVFHDPTMLDYRRLCREIESPLSVWIVAERDGEIRFALSLLLDKEHGIAKANRLLVDPNWTDSESLLKGALPLLYPYLKGKQIEVIYTSTRTLPLVQQEMTLGTGFRVLGVFPAAAGSDPWKIIGLLGFFYEGVLENRRYTDFSVHPYIAPIFEIARKQCGLPALPIAVLPQIDPGNYERLPSLEFLSAPDFVAKRYQWLKQRALLSVNFYPFHEPNALVTDVESRIEIFIRMMPDSRSAAIIGERLDRPVNPTHLYDRVAMMVNQRGISFIEVINDAADRVGIDLICRAGFIPCAYFPSFKRQADVRRDYVVMARSFERLMGAADRSRLMHPVYLDYLAEFHRLDEQIQNERFRPPT